MKTDLTSRALVSCTWSKYKQTKRAGNRIEARMLRVHLFKFYRTLNTPTHLICNRQNSSLAPKTNKKWMVL